MKKTCGKCQNLYTWDCPKIRPNRDDEDIW